MANISAIALGVPLRAKIYFDLAGFVHENPGTYPYCGAQNQATLSLKSNEARILSPGHHKKAGGNKNEEVMYPQKQVYAVSKICVVSYGMATLR